jgi:hypothetical protein
MSTSCVSGYWNVKNKHDTNYNNWFMNTLAINCPYVFFSNREGIEFIRQFRKDLPTHYIELEIKDFECYKYKDILITDPVHCPSVELNLIWHEKIFLVKRAYELNPFNSEWFNWIDAGHCIYRNEAPPRSIFPNPDKINRLPVDKFIYSSSNDYDESQVYINNYYHHISGTYILHKSLIDKFVLIYKEYLEKLSYSSNVVTDQVVLTHIYKDNKELFYKLCEGYGEVTKYLFKSEIRIQDIKTVFICPDHNTKYNLRKAHIESLLRTIGFTDITHYKSGTEKYPDCLSIATIDILKANMEQPVLILEDDIEFTGIDEFILDKAVDAIYLGLSKSAGSKLFNKDEGFSQFLPWSSTQSRVMNMLATHAILYISPRYKQAVIDTLTRYIGHNYYNDVLISRIQPDFLVLANKKPSFYQSHRFNDCMHQELFTKFELE